MQGASKKLTSFHVIGLWLMSFGVVSLAAGFAGWSSRYVPTPDAAAAAMLAALAFLFHSRPLVGRVAGCVLASLGLAEVQLALFGLRHLSFAQLPGHLALGFMLGGLILAFMHYVTNKRMAWAIEFACLVAVLLGVLHAVDQLTGLRVVSNDLFNVSQTLTALLLVTLGLGLWFSIRQIPWYREFDVGRVDSKITAVSGMVLLLIAFAAAVASFVIMADQTERTMKGALALSLQNRARIFREELENVAHAATDISTRADFRETLGRAMKGRPSREDRARMENALTRLLDRRYMEISAIEMYDAYGRVLARKGTFVPDSLFKVTLPSLVHPAVLVWDEGLVLQLTLNIAERDQHMGALVLDVRLHRLDEILKDRAGLGDTGAVIACAAAGDDMMHCVVAQKDAYRTSAVPRSLGNTDPLPINHALQGESGVSSHYDRSGHEVISAYGAIAPSLGMLIKIDKAELQQPIRKRLWGMLSALAALALVGLLLLRWQIKPLAQRLMQEVFDRRSVEEELRLLQTITAEVGQAKDVHAALRIVLQRLCEATGWVYGQAWLPRADGACLEHSPAWYGEPELESLAAMLQAHTFAPDEGLPGRVWARKKAEWLREDPRSQIANPCPSDIMLEAGFKARMAVPIMADFEVVAVLEFAMRAGRAQDAALLNLATLIAEQLGNAIRRKRAEEALRDSEERYRDLIESVDAIVWQADPETMGATYISPQAERILGYSAKDWLSSPTFWKDHVHPDDREQAVACCVNALREGRGYEFEYRMLAADGRILWFRDKVTVVSQDGRAVQLHGIMLDVTEVKRTAQDLYDSEERYRTFIQNSVEIIYFFDLHTDRILEGNPAFQKMLGYSAEEVTKLTLYDFVEHDKESIRAFSQKILAQGGGLSLGERKWRAKDGKPKHVRVTIGSFKQKDRVIGFAIAGDMTDAKVMAQSLSDSEVRYKALIENSMEAIYLYDPETRQVSDANPAFLSLLGYTAEDLGSISMYDFILHPRNTVGSFTQHFPPGKTGAIAIGERTWVGKNGIRRQMDVTAGRMHQGEKTIGFTVARDITEQKRTQERLTYLAHYDELTGLPNRTLFNENLRQILGESQRRQRLAAVMFLDLDRFKTINDTLGHETGDTLLKAVAERLRQCVRRGDVIARLGGDEFTIALADIAQSDDVALVARKILESFAYPFHIGGRDLFVTTSIGVSLYPQDHEEVDGLLKSADAAMYRAKDLGRNNYQFFTKELNAQASKRLALETHLRRALERNEFLLHYQPQVDLGTGEIVGMEALIRWQNRELGLVSPADFIPLAEETGLIVPIGEWVLRTACTQNKAWQDAGLPALRISVNLSARQFRDKTLIETVTQALDRTGLAPEYLELELTESLLQNVDTAEVVLKELHGLGVHLSVDDFGTGYSSLNYLKRFPIDNLKIDRSFIRDVISNADDAAITDAIITMAHTLGIYVVAEGVETREQLAFLHQHRCDLIQGYYFSKPLAAEAFVELLNSGRKLLPGDQNAPSKKTVQR